LPEVGRGGGGGEEEEDKEKITDSRVEKSIVVSSYSTILVNRKTR
jgi:hypothetical protein